MECPMLLSPSAPRFSPRSHARTPSKSPTRHRIMDDILADLSPSTTLEAFTSAPGKMKASIEAASPTQRAFGIRAAIASKKIQEWVTELSGWPWPARGSGGFLVPAAKRRKISDDHPLRHSSEDTHDRATDTAEFWGSLPAEDVMRYESRIDDIWEDMEDLDVEEIKRQILETHVLPRSRPSTPQSIGRSSPRAPPPFVSYTRIDDFTAVVTATVLQALPNLSRLNALMNIWSIRLAMLRQVPPLLLALDETEFALRSGWKAINAAETINAVTDYKTTSGTAESTITRHEFEVMRNTLQDMVTILGQRLDHMLDALEGQEDTIPGSWLDRMETIEQEYGEWAVYGDIKVREGEWAREASQRQQKRLPKASPGSSPTALRDPKKLESREKQSTTTESEDDHTIGQNSFEETHANSKKTSPNSPPPATYSSSIETPIEGSLISAEISGGTCSPEPPEQDTSQIRGYIVPTARRISETKDVEHEDSDVDVNGKPVLNQPRIEKIRQNDSNIKYPASTDNDPEVDDLNHTEPITAGTVKSPDAALPGEEGANVPVTYTIQPMSDIDQQQLTPSPRSPIPRFPPVDSSQDVGGVPQLQGMSRQPQDNPSASKLIDSANNTSPADGEWNDMDLPTGGNQHTLLPPNRAEPGVSEDRGVSNSSLSRDEIKENNIGPEPLHSSIPPRAKDRTQSIDPEHATQRENSGAAEPSTPPSSKFSLAAPELSDDDEASSTPRTPSPSTKPSIIHATTSLSDQPRNGYYAEDSGTPRSPSKAQRLTLDFTNALKQLKPPKPPSQSSVSHTSAPDQTPDIIELAHNSSLLHPLPISEDDVSRQEAEVRVPDPIISNGCPSLMEGAEQTPPSNESTATPKIESPDSAMPNVTLQARLPPTHLHSSENSLEDTKVKTDAYTEKPLVERVDARTPNSKTNEISIISPPINNNDGNLDVSDNVKPTQLPLLLPASSTPETILTQDTPATQPVSPTRSHKLDHTASPEDASIGSSRDEIPRSVDGADMTVNYKNEGSAWDSHVPEPAVTPRRESISSDTSTIINSRRTHSIETPRASSPIGTEAPSPITVGEPVSSDNIDEESPFLNRIRVYGDLRSYSPPSSPPSISVTSKRRQLQSISSTPFDPNALSPHSPVTLGEPPFLSSVEVSPAPISSPSKISADQFQQQISEILGSIPARIRLASEPDSDQRSDTTQPKKRPSLGTGFRPMSRSSTPSFTLAPAYAKNPRPRAQNGSPEIKLYHLSRGTGEAPIKLFVRLVGEHGERVMVRVGGGWADLGEYLKEYASHHGRKSDKAGKVEIQDLPSRVVSVGSASNLMNGNGRSSPVSRPTSSLDRPLSSLAVRKTRKSVGEDTLGRQQRSPSTPQPYALRNTPPVPRQSETPPSATSRPVSRLSWSEEESPLGLAGPTSKKVDISAENAAWVESMKEKVRMASAEKKEKTTPTATDFGQLGKVGGTKRLFKKGAT